MTSRPRRDDLDVDVEVLGDVPPSVIEARREHKRVDEANEKILQPRIDAHLEAYRAAVDELKTLHDAAGVFGDFELTAETRQAASWQVSGRVIGWLHAALSLLEAGYASEVAPLLRSAHEGSRLLSQVVFAREATVLREWLADRHVKPSRVLRSQDQYEHWAGERMAAEGLEVPRRTRDALEALYKFLSELTHVKRSRVEGLVSVPQRQLPVGPHPDVRVRAVFVGYTGNHVLEATGEVGFALSLILGLEVARERTQPTFRALSDLLEKIPLDADAVRGAP